MNSENHNQLRLSIQKKVGYPIENLNEIKIVQETIEWSIKKKISFNTLRRFFGFLQSTTPSLKTLNTLSQFIGYENYSDFQKKQMQDLDWFVWVQTIKIEVSNTLNEADFRWLESQQNTFDYHLQIASIIKTFIYKKKYEVLNQFFDPRVFRFDESTQLKLAANICLLFRSLDEENIKLIANNIVQNQLFRENILHWFVDYSYFNGYYGKFIKEARKYALPESHEALFYDLVINYNNYLSCNSNLEWIDLNRIKPNFFVVLQGRCYAYNLVYFIEQKNKNEFAKTWNSVLKKIKKSGQTNMLTIEIFPALLLIRDLEKTNYLIQNYYEDLLTLENWSGYTFQAMILIAQSLELIQQSKFKEASIGFNLIDTNRFNLHYTDYTQFFYLIVKYHLAKANLLDSSVLNAIQQEYESIGIKTGFKRFSVHFLTHYFSDTILY